MKTIQQYRKALGLTVDQLLNLVGWSLSTYKRVSNGTRSLSKLEEEGLESFVSKRKPGRPKKVR